jgi:hypothetical protein
VIRVRGIVLAASAGAAFALASCVTEKPAPAAGRAVPPRPAGSAPASAALPPGPVATPAAGAAQSTVRLRLAIRPLGSVPYDGQVLPLVSPDGRFLATQTGLAPSWELILAVPGVTETPGVRPLVYDLSQQPAAEVAPANPLPPGLMLGRSADTRGYLVENPRPDGSRWIGRVDWLTGEVAWAANDAAVNAHATLTPDGSVVWSRRSTGAGDEARSELVVRSAEGVATLADPDWSFMFPTIGDDPGLVFCFAVGRSSMELIAVRLRTGDGPPRFGAVVSRRVFSRQPDAALAYQSIASAQTPPPTPATPPVGLAFFNPTAGRMAEWDAKSGVVSLLPERSVAAVRAAGLAPGGFFVTTEGGLVFSPDLEGDKTNPDGTAKPRPAPGSLFDLPNIVRATRSPVAPIIMMGPLRDSSEPRLAIIAAAPAPPEPPAQAGGESSRPR